MLFAVYYIVPVLIVLKVFDVLRTKNIDLRYQYKFHKLRDDLRMLAINKKVDKNGNYIPVRPC